MFSSHFPAATASRIPSPSASDPIAARGAATGSTHDGPSFGDALSAAAADDESASPQDATARQPSSMRASAHAHAHNHHAVMVDAKAAEGAKTGERRRSSQTSDGQADQNVDASPAAIVPDMVALATHDPAPPLVPAWQADQTNGESAEDVASQPETGSALRGLPPASVVLLRSIQPATNTTPDATQESADASDLHTGERQTSDIDAAALRATMAQRALVLAATSDKSQQQMSAPEMSKSSAAPAGASKTQTPTLSFSAGASATIAAAALDPSSKTSIAPTARETTPMPAVAPSATAARVVATSGLDATALPLTTPIAAPSTSAAAPQTLPSSVTQQIIDAIRLQWTEGRGTAHIELEPSHFGELNVSLRVEQGQVTARLEASSPAVREWLQTNEASLRHGLAEQHLTLDRLEVAEPPEPKDADRRGQPQQQPARDGRPPRRSSRRDAAERFEIVA